MRPRPTLILRLEGSFHWNFALADRSGGPAAMKMTLISKESRKVPLDFFLKEPKLAEAKVEVKTIVRRALSLATGLSHLLHYSKHRGVRLSNPSRLC